MKIKKLFKSIVGFSMIEVLIAISIVGVIGVFTTTILSRTYRAGNQGVALSRLKQNGELAMDIMSDAIRNSEGVVCYGPPTSTRKTEIVIRTLEGKYTKFKFEDPGLAGNTVTSNGFITKQENLNPTGYATFCTAPITTPVAVPITNSNNSSGVSISLGEFKKLTPQSTSKDSVMISFTVNRSLSQSATTESDIALMQTTVQVR